MKKRMLSLLLAVCLVVSMAPAAFAANGTTTTADTEKATIATDKGAELYSDVPADSWFVESVDTVTKNGYFNGYPDGTFKPSEAMTRAMFVTVISRMAEAETDDTVTKFPDVPVNTWYTGAVTWANENGIVLGRSDTVFDPNTAITRIEMCIIMSRYVKYLAAETGKTIKATEEAKTFTDTKELSESYLDALNNCVAYGLIQGYTNGTFGPNNGATRAEVATVVARLADKTTEKKPDTSGGSYWTPTTPEQTEFTVTYTATVGDATFGCTDTATKDEPYTVLTWDQFYAKSTDTNKVQPETEDQKFADWTVGGNVYSGGDKMDVTADITLSANLVDLHDKIFIALKEAEQKAKDWFNDKYEAVTSAEPAATTYGDVVLSKVDVTGADKSGSDATRDILVEGSVSIEGLELETKIVTVAAHAAQSVLGGQSAGQTAQGYKNELTELARGIAHALGIYNIDRTSLSTIVDSLYTWGNGEIHNILTGCGLAEAIKTVTVEIEGAQPVTVTVNPSDHSVSLGGSTDKKTVAKNLGIALAKQLYASAQTASTSSGEYLNEVPVEGNITLKFEPQESNNYPKNYEVKLALTLSDKDGLVAYKFEDGKNYVRLTLAEGMQTAYNTEVAAVIDSLSDNESFTNTINAKIEKAKSDMSEDTTIAALNDIMKEYGDDSTGATVSKAVDDWIAANVKADDLVNSAIVTGEFDNTAIFNLITTVANTVAEEVDTKLTDVVEKQTNDFDKQVAEAAVGVIREAKPTELLDSLSSDSGLLQTVGGLDFDPQKLQDLKTEAPNVADYVMAVVCDRINTEKQNHTANYVGKMQDDVEVLISGKLNDVIDEGAMTLLDLRTFKGLQETTLAELNEMLESDIVKSITSSSGSGGSSGGSGDGGIEQYLDRAVNAFKRVANYLGKYEGKVTITLSSGTNPVEITTKNLQDFANGDIATFFDFYEKIDSLNLGGLSLNEMTDKDWCVITFTAGGTEITVCPWLVIPEITAQ